MQFAISLLLNILLSIFQVPTINQDTAVSASEPTETLVKFRSGKVLCPGRKGQGQVMILPINICNNYLNILNRDCYMKIGLTGLLRTKYGMPGFT